MEAVIRNLMDAGCDQKTIDLFFKEHECGNLKNELKVLENYRKSLLDSLHEKQRQIDCLDYLIYKLRKEI